MSSATKKSFVFSPPQLLLGVIAVALVATWVMVAVGGYLGIGLYRDLLQLREQNVYLRQKKKELAELGQTIKRIKNDEEIIRDVFLLEKDRVVATALGQGGMPTTDLSSIVSQEKLPSSSNLLPVETNSLSILEEAESLQKSLQELVQTMREKRRRLEHTPSIMPVKARDYWFSSGFGWRRSPFTGLKEFHDGVDISAHKETPIIAPGNGRVIKGGYHRYRGKYLQILHGWGYITSYSHLSRISVTIGQEVKRGETIGFMGNTGRSTGYHLHYEIEINGKVANPLQYIFNLKTNRILEVTFQAEGGQQ